MFNKLRSRLLGNEMVKQIGHIGWAVSGEFARRLKSSTAGIAWKIDEERKLSIGFLKEKGGGAVEFIEPLEGERAVSKFLEKFGSGFHHVCFEVKDLRGLYDRLKTSGVRVVGELEKGAEGREVFFVHPGEAGGILIEFIQAEEG